MLKNISFQSANQQEILAYSYVSEHSKNFLILKDKIAFLAAGGVDPPLANNQSKILFLRAPFGRR